MTKQELYGFYSLNKSEIKNVNTYLKKIKSIFVLCNDNEFGCLREMIDLSFENEEFKSKEE